LYFQQLIVETANGKLLCYHPAYISVSNVASVFGEEKTLGDSPPGYW